MTDFADQLPQDTEDKEAYEGESNPLYGGKTKEEVTYDFPTGEIHYTTTDSNGQRVEHFDFPNALPLLDTSTSYLVDRSSREQATARHSLTFTGKIVRPAGNLTVRDIFLEQKAMRDNLRGNKFWHIKLTKDGVTICEFANCRLTSLDFDAGRYYSNADYTITFESTDLAVDNLETYAVSTDISSTEGMGYFQAGYIVSTNHYEFSTNVSGSSLDVDAAGTALNLIALKNGDTVRIAGDGRTFTAKNVTVNNTSANASTGEVSIESKGVLVPDDVDQRFIVGLTTSVTRGDSQPKLAVDGSLLSLDFNSSAPDVFYIFENSLYNIVKNASGLNNNEQVRPPLAPLTSSHTSSSIDYNELDNTVSYAYEYDICDRYRITNTTSEKITIDDDKPKAIIARIPTMGKSNGPILQSMSAATAGKKTMSIEATFVNGRNFNTEFASLQQLIIDETPQGDVAFRLAMNTSQEVNSNTIQADLEWVYSDSYLFAKDPNNNPIQNFVVPEDENAGYTVGFVDCASMWQGGITKQFSLVNTESGQAAQNAYEGGSIHPGYGAYHNDLFSISSNGNLRTEANFDYETRNVYLVRVRCDATRIRDGNKYTYYGVFRILIGPVNEVSDSSALPPIHVDPPENLMISNKSVFPYSPIGTVVGKVELVDPDLMTPNHTDPFIRNSYMSQSTNISSDFIRRPSYFVSGGIHSDLFVIRGDYLITTEVLNPTEDIGGSVESPLEEYNIIITAVESDSSGFVTKKSGKVNHIYNRELSITVLTEED